MEQWGLSWYGDLLALLNAHAIPGSELSQVDGAAMRESLRAVLGPEHLNPGA